MKRSHSSKKGNKVLNEILAIKYAHDTQKLWIGDNLRAFCFNLKFRQFQSILDSINLCAQLYVGV